MQEKEKQVGEAMIEAVSTLPEEKKQYFIGFAEGVRAMAPLTKKQKGES